MVLRNSADALKILERSNERLEKLEMVSDVSRLKFTMGMTF
jgi:hypothetical protein